MTAAAEPLLPRYGERSLADLVPSLAAALGAPGFPNPLAIDPCPRAVVLLVDGLGAQLLQTHRAIAPTLTGLAGEPMTAGFPSTTATSLSSLGTGRPPGEHGLVGYTMLVPGQPRPLNVLRWELAGPGAPVDLREAVPPEQLQPDATAFERATAAGVRVVLVGSPVLAHSGLTRASLRGGTHVAAHSLADVITETARVLREPGPALVYAYHAELDLLGHVRGVDSDAWRTHLALVDHAVGMLLERLPAGTRLVVTGDHGMLDLPAADKVDLDREPHLLEGVRMLAGEPRARHLMVAAGAVGDVLAAWRQRLDGRAWILEREAVIAAGWFGPQVLDRVRARIGDLVVAARGTTGVVQPSVDGRLAELIGHHGSLTAAELLIPYVTAVR